AFRLHSESDRLNCQTHGPSHMNSSNHEPLGVLGHQSLRRRLTESEERLAASLVGIFGNGVHDFALVAEELQRQGVPRPSGASDPWTVESLEYELKSINASLDEAYLGGLPNAERG